MITAEIFYDEMRSRKGFIVKGHAGMAEKGQDLVCSGVSALTQAAILGLEAVLHKKPDWKIDSDGYLECWLPSDLNDEESLQAQAIIHTVELGLTGIEKDYGKYLKVSKRRCTKDD